MLAALLGLWVGTGLHAQTQNPESKEIKTAGGKGAVSGTVQDQTGAVIAGVTVTITDAAAVSQSNSSDEKGEYRFDGLTPGAYKVKVTSTWFTDFVTEGLIVSAGET